MRILTLIVTIIIFYNISFSQQVQMKNLRNFDNRMFHFGFALGYNSSDFYLDRNALSGFNKIHY